jgi:hypothetical protein
MAMSTGEATQFSSCSINYANSFMNGNPACLKNAPVNAVLPTSSSDSSVHTAPVESPASPIASTTTDAAANTANVATAVSAVDNQEIGIPIDRVGEPEESIVTIFMHKYSAAFVVGTVFGAIIVGSVLFAIQCENKRRNAKALMPGNLPSDSATMSTNIQVVAEQV